MRLQQLGLPHVLTPALQAEPENWPLTESIQAAAALGLNLETPTTKDFIAAKTNPSVFNLGYI